MRQLVMTGCISICKGVFNLDLTRKDLYFIQKIATEWAEEYGFFEPFDLEHLTKFGAVDDYHNIHSLLSRLHRVLDCKAHTHVLGVTIARDGCNVDKLGDKLERMNRDTMRVQGQRGGGTNPLDSTTGAHQYRMPTTEEINSFEERRG